MINLLNISDKIPVNFVKPKRLWRNDGHHLVNPVKYRNLPEEFDYRIRSRLCFNVGANGHEPGFVRRIPGCETCDGVYHWFAYFCVACGKEFVRDFRDYRHCSLFPTCWDCTQQMPWDECPDHKHTKEFYLKMPAFPPVGLNPKTHTKEELDRIYSDFNFPRLNL